MNLKTLAREKRKLNCYLWTYKIKGPFGVRNKPLECYSYEIAIFWFGKDLILGIVILVNIINPFYTQKLTPFKKKKKKLKKKNGKKERGKLGI